VPREALAAVEAVRSFPRQEDKLVLVVQETETVEFLSCLEEDEEERPSAVAFLL
jgi:hypothetical protein